MKNLAATLVLLCATAAAPTLRAQGGATPQQQPPTVASVLNTLYGIVEQQVVSAAEAMPEDKYSFAPTNGEFKGVRTFAEEVKHIGFANHLFFGPLMGETIDVKSLEQNTNGPAELKTKAEIIQYLKDSFALGHRAIATITSENQVTPLAKPVLPFLSTRLAIASIADWHAGDHYGQMVEYLRMNGIIPPASRPRPPQPPSAQKGPPEIQPPAGERRLLFQVHAEGDQVYTCKGDGAQFAWTLKGPDAKLFDKDGKPFGKHSAGPSWEANDGSHVTGQAVKNASVDANSIPWLLVKIISHDGNGVLSPATYIQRLNTKGGKAPSSVCDASHAGPEVRVPYSADYLFYAPE